MKKITLLGLSVLALAAVSCNINELPKFDDNDAFVAFLSSSYTISEDGGTLSIPIHVSSLSNPGATVSVQVTDGTAKQGTDYTLANATGVVNIPAGSSEGKLDIQIHPMLGVFTGDKSFTIQIASAGDLDLGEAVTTKVTISDIDHPLSALFGTYTGAYTDAWGYDYDASITLSKDDDDVTLVWFSNFDPSYSGYCTNKVYGIVNDDMTTITIPKGQACDYSSYFTLYWSGYTDDEFEAECDIVLSISEDKNTLTFQTNWGMFCSKDTYYDGYYDNSFFTAYYAEDCSPLTK